MFGPFFIKGGQKQIFSNTWARPDFADYKFAATYKKIRKI